MTNKKQTKRALLASVVSMLLCFTMLLGTTFAWFTDSASSINNVIKSGNLDVVLEVGTFKDGVSKDNAADPANWDWSDVEKTQKKLFDIDNVEPGYVETVAIRVRNNGSLALKFNLLTSIVNEKQGTNKAGDKFSLSDHLKVVVAPSLDSRSILHGLANDTISASGIGAYVADIGDVLENDIVLSAGKEKWYTMAIVMPESVNNVANHNGVDKPELTLGVNVVATQYTEEEDSFDNKYDEDAEYTVAVSTMAELKAAFANGGNVALVSDIDITELVTIPAGVEVHLDMNGKTIAPASANVDPLFDVKTGAALTIDGNGTFDLGDLGTVNGMSLMYPRGDVTINSGTFKIATNGAKYGSMFVGISGGQGKLIINGGYFDGGYYKEGDCFNNCRNLLNGSWGQYIRVYGGTFVGMNPAWGDEGMAFLCPHCTHTPGIGYCQALFLEGQSREDTVLPEGYTITEGTTADGRPTYTVTYNK